MKQTLCVLLFLLVPSYVFCSDEESEEKHPSYQELMLKNSLVPGLGMSMLGNKEEARVYYAALPLSLAGVGLLTAGVILNNNTIVTEMEYRDGGTVLLDFRSEPAPAAKLLLAGGTLLSLYGNLLAVYSSYAVHSDYVTRYGAPAAFAGPVPGRISMGEVLSAPYIPKNVFNVDVLPILGLSTLTGFSVDDYDSMSRFFRREQVQFFGFPVTPLAGLGLQILFACGFVTANAAWEELAYRGLDLQVRGTFYSSFSFGFAHLTNMLLPGTSVEGTLLQTLFATAFGFYAADRVQRAEDGLKRMIALHFWNNLLSMVLGYLADPEADQIFAIRIRV